MRFLSQIVVFFLASMFSLPVIAGGISEDGARSAIEAYKAKNYQLACNKFADLVAKNDPVAIYYLGYDVDFSNSYCLPITKTLKIYTDFWWGIVRDRNFQDQINKSNSSMLIGYISGEAAGKMIEVSAKAGYGPAQTRLGQLYMRFEVDAYFVRNLDLAASWLQKGSESGSDLAEYLLGVLAENGAAQGTPAEHYIKAADRGHLYSMQLVAQNMYNGDNGFPKDREKALYYLKILANQNGDMNKKKWAITVIQNLYNQNVYRN